ncbi:MAG: class I SAM-dependent methyltransferase [Chloroflexi bacterium]|nr:class I SAM-dependent methyltransferase [Chloroflexota bacterium]
MNMQDQPRHIPETLERDWDRFYLEFPDIYDRFARSSEGIVRAIDELFGLRDKLVLDIASGTGRSTFAMARLAKRVIGIDPWASMRNLAIKRAQELGILNVEFLDATGEDIPLDGDSVDIAVSVYGIPIVWDDPSRTLGDARRFASETHRVVRESGYVVTAGSAPGWLAAELTHIVCPNDDHAHRYDSLLTDTLGFSHRDISVTVDYGSVQEAVETYGFINGRKAIGYLRAHNKSTIEWRHRIHYKKVEKPGL